ncbi:MAG: tetratricopeptide repeat protein, partial [Gemmataceae bacterium]|nr:tetratricopeptide repeat protein [Gemmataceae bacterium]
MLAAHFIAAAPLAWLLAVPLARSAEAPVGLWLMLAAIAGLIAPLVSPAIASALDAVEANLLVRTVCRSAIALVFILPGMAASAALASEISASPSVISTDGPSSRTPKIALTAAATLALVPPGVYADQLIERRLPQVKTELRSGRFVKARRLILALRETGGNEVIAEVESLTELDRKIERLADRVKHPLPNSAPLGRRVERAFLLIQLDRLEEAAELLEPLAVDDPATAGLLLAGIRRDQKRWPEAVTVYRRVVEQLPATAQEARQTAFQGLAEALVAAGQPHDAEAVYRQALEQMPTQAAYWHWQLGQHFFRGGRPATALEHLHEAEKLDPTTVGPKVAPLLESIRRATPGCLLR